MSDIIVIGRREPSWYDFTVWAYTISESSGYEPYPYLSNEGAGGGPPPSETTYSFYGQCNSKESMTKAASDKIKSISGSSSNEFSATVIAAGGGLYQIIEIRFLLSFLITNLECMFRGNLRQRCPFSFTPIPLT